MKIRKFNEQEEIIEISNDRVNEIVQELNSINSLLQDKSEYT